MLKNINSVLIFVICVFSSMACSQKTAVNELTQLLPDTCLPIASSNITVNLGIKWQPYLFATRVCPLEKQKGVKANIYLISIFIEDYYRDKPADSPWEQFPTPVLVNEKGTQVGVVSELFPEESPGEMVLTYGKWVGNIPGEIKMHVLHPGVAGDYDLPTLYWHAEKKQYAVEALFLK